MSHQLNIEETVKSIEEISQYRLDICFKCPLYSTKYGGICNNKLWFNKDTGDVSIEKKPGYKSGCGCLLASKTKNINNSCPLEKW